MKAEERYAAYCETASAYWEPPVEEVLAEWQLAIVLLRRCHDILQVECNDLAHRHNLNPDWLQLERDLEAYLEGGDET